MDYLSPYLNELGQGVQVVGALRSAADQQQRMAEQKRQFDIENALRQKEFDANQANRAFSQRLGLLSGGAQPVVGDLQGSPEVMRPGTVAGSNLSLTAPAPVDAGRVVGSGGSQYYVPTPEETSQRDLEATVNRARALRGVQEEGYPQLLGPLAQAAGLPEGTRLPPAAFGAITRMFGQISKQPKEAAPKQPGYWATNQENGAVSYVTPGENGKLNVTSTGPGVGKTRAPASDQQKPPTRQQFAAIGQRKDKAIADSIKAYQKEKSDVTLEPGEAAQNHIARLRQAQQAYEDEVGTLTGNPVGHNDWADRLTPQQIEPPKQQAAQTPQHKVGDTVNYQGKPHKIASITKEGKLVLQPLQ